MSDHADLVVTGGRVLTMDAERPEAEAVAIAGGRIAAVGSAREVRRLAGPRTELIDAAGGTVLPGINDSHLHLSTWPLLAEPYTRNVAVPTIEELVARVRAAVDEAAEPGSWIRGVGWNAHSVLPRAPTRHDLDPVSPHHPVILRDFTVHSVVVNTRALELAGVTRDTEPPLGGLIERDAAGEPTGVLRESAIKLVDDVVAPFRRVEVEDALRRAGRLLPALGITSVTDPGVDLADLALLGALATGEAPSLRVSGLLRQERDLLAAASPEGFAAVLDAYVPREDVDPRWLRVLGIKVWADGNPPAQTAWMHQPYRDGTNGSLTIAGASVEEQLANLAAIVNLADGAGLQVGTHATGDAAVDAVVEAYLGVIRRRSGNPRRHYVIHCGFTRPETLATMGRHDILANMNPIIKRVLGTSMEARVGAARTRAQAPCGTAVRSGVRVACASDAPIFDPDWLLGVQAAVTRRSADGRVSGPEEAMALRDALAAYTSVPAWQDHAESWKGRLRAGFAADLCMLDGDVLDVDADALHTLAVEATVVDGTVAYERHGATAARAARAVTAAASGAHAERGCCCERSHEIRQGNV